MEALALPPCGSWYIHHDGRVGTFVRRTKRHDPITGTIVQTAVTFQCVNSDGRRATWSLKCAGPRPVARRAAADARS
ncbi:hypothetical protein [Streptomyces sp. FH025]|uniref:hypothetical protein n=1 Tax=Streptomyces sp. FH025 TaxID=2815937 RepID=UPI001A9F16E4|nr:hypothetical protein [Streptomyces sp. FH025]MBO1415243.1 hypothetical protein [Streptomyces sp. FH025]